jgi:hypothetical protein
MWGPGRSLPLLSVASAGDSSAQEGRRLAKRYDSQERLFLRDRYLGRVLGWGRGSTAYFSYAEVRMHILEHELEDGRFQYVQLERRENVALYTQTHKASGTIRYEVIKIRIQPEHTWPTGVTTPEKEAYPGSGSWGRDGWTFFEITAAQQKMRELLASAADDLPQAVAVEDAGLQ